jgi:hypothetical protein
MSASSEQQEKLVYRHFQTRNGGCDDPEYDQNQADKGQIVRPVRMMDQRHNIPPKRILDDPLEGSCASSRRSAR